MARVSGLRGGLTMGGGLKLVLLLQGLIAMVLLVTDMGDRVRMPSFDGPSPTGPIAPGDQVRHYEPTRTVPRFVDPSVQPDVDFPADLPSRLEFTLHDDPDMGEVLLLNGAITAGDGARLEAYFTDQPDSPAVVALNSPGGNVDEALGIGRILRAREADTTILPGMACLSSCPYVLAAGTERRVSAEGSVGLHQHYYDTPGYIPVYFAVADIQRNQGETMAYLIDMGVDPGVMVHGLNTPPEEIYVLVAEELLDTRLATEMLE